MLFFDSLSAVPEGFGPSAVAIGKFDGVHSGHRAVISALGDAARADGLAATVVTFDRHPLSLLRPESCPEPLLSNAQKVERLAETGVDATLMVEFDRPFSQLSPEQFVQRILVDSLHARIVFVGSDFRFGAAGAGTVHTLTELGSAAGFEVRLIDDVVATGERRASSTWIRELLAEGLVEEAAAVLGHEPTIRSVVVHGLQRGRELGYPTANLSPQIEGFVPADGVYAAWLTVGAKRYGAAVSIGNNPTFDGIPDKQVEAHVLDANLDLYDATVELSFVRYIRGMRKFSGMDALALQMTADERDIRMVLGYPARV
ncbi:MAG: bifunctional riboflavin kinase/FAD synthetase [Microbacteriaceae bacterium]